MSRYARARDREIIAELRRARQPKLTAGDEHAWRNRDHDFRCHKCGYNECGCARMAKPTPQLICDQAFAPQPEPAKSGPVRFQVGDVVRCKEDYHGQFLTTGRYVIKEAFDSGSCGICSALSQWLRFERDSFGSTTNGWCSCHFELVRRASGPTQTEPKLREGWELRAGNRMTYDFYAGGCISEYCIDNTFVAKECPGGKIIVDHVSFGAAMDAVEDAVLGAQGWRRATELAEIDSSWGMVERWKHATGVSAVKSDKGIWSASIKRMLHGAFQTRAEAMALALGAQP